MDAFTNFLGKVDDIVWGLPLIILIIVCGIYLTIRLKFLQIVHLPKALRFMIKNEEDGTGEVTSFGALCTALSATIGTGNIVGVATAIVSGGPGALFWMWLAALVGTATKYAECLLAVKFRQVDEDGHVVGGPFNYIEHGMGPKWKWLAKIFAFFGIGVGLLGIGTFTQVNGISSAVNNFFDPNNAWTVSLFGRTYSWTVVISCLILTFCVALVLIGGIQRISKVAQVIVPFMAATYFLAGILIILFNITDVPAAILTIVQSAFGLKAAAGGALGAMVVAMQKGIARGIFSNEAGLGSAPIAAAAARTNEPVRQGLVSMTGTFIDTIIICSITGIAIVLSGLWNSGLDGAVLTMRAFDQLLPGGIGGFICLASVVLFGFSCLISYYTYAERAGEYIFGQKIKPIIKALWVVIILIGSQSTLGFAWDLADTFNGLMIIPNLIGIILLSNEAVKMKNDYFKRNNVEKIKK